MSDDLEHLMMRPPPTADRPLRGLTVLVVEDSRFASEAIRLLSLRSGARIRRADCLRAAHRHLRVYRPTIVIIDMGLPDGSGADLIAELSADPVRVPVLLAMSGDADTKDQAIAAGADGFMEKPVESLATFQQIILSILPPTEGPKGPRALPQDVISPDTLALQDDLTHVAELMRSKGDAEMQDYVAQFLSVLARSAQDRPLEKAADRLVRACAEGRGVRSDWERVEALVQDRLSERIVI